MGSKMWMVGIAAAAFCGILIGCGPIETHNTVVIDQPKPLEVNVNLSGKLELVITDARKDLETITGEKPKREVKPEDIGLPADASPRSALPAKGQERVALLAIFSGEQPGAATYAVAAASENELLKSMAARNENVRAMLSAKVAGEAHTGLLVPRGSLTPQQTETLNAENADRSALYELRAAKNKTTVAEAALAYYLQRLGYAQKGDWVEKFNKQTKQWEWIQWAG